VRSCVSTPGSSALQCSSERFETNCEIDVETRRSDDLLEAANCHRADLVKLDAEGGPRNARSPLSAGTNSEK
jgi:FkbM family methyltransferase